MTKIKCDYVEQNLSNSIEYFGHFIFTSLEHGEGSTLANMIRRTLLTSLSGFKVIGLRMTNVNNEFSNVGGVREDLLEIILNLKEIIFQNSANHSSCYGRLKVYGPAIVTAGCLELPKDVKVLNPQNHLLTVTEETLIELEVKIERGKTYILAKDRKQLGPDDFLPIDANFTPILKVNTYIHPILEEVDNSDEEVHLQVYTDGTLLPQQALQLAGNKLASMILSFREIKTFTKLEEVKEKNSRINIFMKNEQKTNDDQINKTNESKMINKTNENKMINKTKGSKMINKTKGSKMINKTKESKMIKIEKRKNINLDKTNPNKNNQPNKGKSDHDTIDIFQEMFGETQENKADGKRPEKETEISSIFTTDRVTNNQRQKRRNSNKNPILDNMPTNKKQKFVKAELTQNSEEIDTGKLEELGLSKRINQILQKANIKHIVDLIECTSADLKKIKGLGAISIKEINEKIDLFYEQLLN